MAGKQLCFSDYDLITAKLQTHMAHIRPKFEHPFRVIKQQFGFQKPRCVVWQRTIARSL
jgi:hypothetical protein